MRCFLVTVLLLCACGDDDATIDSGLDAAADVAADGAMDDAGPVDAGPPPACLDSSEVVMYPTPLWEGTDGLTPPANDRAVDLLAVRDAWAGQLSAVDGWPHRPTMIFALWGTGTEVMPDRIHLFADDGSTLTELPIPLNAAIENGGESLVVIPEDPVPVEHTRVVVAIEPGAVVGAVPVPACEGGEAHPDYASLAARLDGDWDLAVGFGLSSIHEELPALYEALVAAPSLSVDSVNALVVDDAEVMPSDAVLTAARTPIADGIYSVPSYKGTDGRFVLESGVPVAQGTTAPGFTVVLPATGDAPFPWVIYQHGGGQHRHIALRNIDALLTQGFAVVSVDLPEHGDRLPAGAMGGDFDILDFDDPLGSRDNLRQGAADHMALVTGVDALNTALEPIFGVEVTLDPDDVRYTGMSLGAFTGSLSFTAATEIKAAALFVGGGGYQEVLSDGLFNVILADVFRGSRVSRIAVAGLAQVYLEGADPLVYAIAEDTERPMLFMEAIDDPLVPNGPTDRWARGFRADLAAPFDHGVLGMAEVALPANVTRALVQAPMAEVTVIDKHGALIELDYAKEAVAHCFQTHRDDGNCELIDTGWSTR